MNNQYKEVDKLITEALSEEESKYFEELEEQAIPFQFLELFKGKNAWATYLIIPVMIALLILGIYAAYHFFTSDELIEVVRWGIIFLIAMIGMSLLKLFSWNQMDKNTIIREIKRLEYQISLLSRDK